MPVDPAVAAERARQREFLKSRRERIFACAQKILSSGERVTEKNHHMFSASLDRLAKLQVEYDSCQDEILELNTQLSKEDQLATTQQQERFDEIVEAAQMKLLAFNTPPARVAVTASSSAAGAAPPEVFYGDAVKLSPLAVPHFDGDAATWPTFFNIYNSIIHNNPRLSPIAKMQRLVTYLSGEPFSMVGTMDITVANYTAAYDMLKERYHNEKKCVLRHYQGLLNLPIVTTGAHISQLRAKLSEHMHGLAGFKQEKATYGNFLVAVILGKLSKYYLRRLDDHRDDATTWPTLDEVIAFLKTECSLIIESPKPASVQKSSGAKVLFTDSSAPKLNSFQQAGQRRSGSKYNQAVSPPAQSTPSAPRPTCGGCGGPHLIYSCEIYKGLSVPERRELVREKGLCYNCLARHLVKNCGSTENCGQCGQRHHSSLHLEQPALTAMVNSPEESEPESFDSPEGTPPDFNGVVRANPFFVAHAAQRPSSTVLPTVRFLLRSPRGFKLNVRAILDSAANRTFITTNVAQILNLHVSRDISAVSGMSHISVPIEGITEVDILDLKENVAFAKITAMVVRSITGHTPSVAVSPEVREKFSAYPLGDPRFDCPSPVDVLLGADYFGLTLTGQKVTLGRNEPIGLGTLFGLAIIGPTPTQKRQETLSSHLVALLTSCPPPPAPLAESLSKQVAKFWELESIPAPSKLSPDEEAAESLYQKTTVQQENGRYLVRLPFRPKHPPLGKSRFAAEKRLAGLNKRFERDPAFKEAYEKFMADYLKNNHMSPAPPGTRLEDGRHFFLPHHGVFRATSSTTKLRVVFDGSMPSSNGVSLNSILLPGPALQADIREVLMNFRRHPVCFTADIKQMFLNVDIHEEDRPYQVLLWSSQPQAPPHIYFLNTVTFGITCSPYLAIRTLWQLAKDHGHKFPNAARILLKEIFVDDLVSGGNSPEEVAKIMDELVALLALGGFALRKWTSSHPEILKRFPADELEIPALDDADNPRLSVLGLKWLPQKDAFTYEANFKTPPLTKRGVLSAVASIYDPCGFLGPLVVRAKAFIQELWREKIGWDEPLTDDLASRWKRFLESLSELKNILVPRLLYTPGATHFQIHGFADASQVAYAAVLYLRASIGPDSPATVSLIIAKSRVAPLAPISIPRLELCAATLLADLLTAYLEKLEEHYPVEKTACWSDSTVTLSWIRIPAYRLQTFVSNRVAKIQELNNEISWAHVRSEHNPADCLSKGVLASELVNHRLWWHGPPWLSEPPSVWPLPVQTLPEEKIPELKSPVTALFVSLDHPAIPVSSSWSRQIRVVAWVMRYFLNLRKYIAKVRLDPSCRLTETKEFNPKDEPLLFSEMVRSELLLLKYIQFSFADEFKRIKEKRDCSPRVQPLTPFVDEKGLLRVGGRLQNSDLDPDSCHPILLPGNHPLVRLLADETHRENLHAGVRLLEATLARRYWILSARNLLRSCVHRCIPCFRAKPRTQIPLMGNLPDVRVQANPPYKISGMDLCGPFSVKIHQLRSARTVDVYLCIFICLSTKAAHLEIVHDLTAPAFIAALHRFASRRGCPSDLYSDNGSNFVGAKNIIEKIQKETDPEIRDFLLSTRIKFHFIPAHAPFQGGIWERAVRSAKEHIKRTIGTTVLYLHEFQTLCCRVEAMLNSRPLTALSANPNDLQPLTPGHFLIGRPLNSPPVPAFDDEDIPRARRWQLVEAFFQRIWRRWQAEYIHTLQPRGKWTKNPPNVLEVDSLVLIHEPGLPPLAWRLGRVVKVHPGKDGIIRVATVRTTTGEIQRPAQRLYPLPLQ